MIGLAGRRKLRRGAEGFKSVKAEIVRAPFQIRRVEIQLHLISQERNVLEEDLLLQRLGGGGNDDLATRENGGDEGSQRLCRSGGRLRQKGSAGLQGAPAPPGPVVVLPAGLVFRR